MRESIDNEEERVMRARARGLLPILLFAGIGCGGGSGKTTVPTTGPWVPLKVGNRWTYTVTDVDGKVSAKVQGVTAETVVGGTGPNASKPAFKLVTGDKYDDKNGDVSYQNWVGDVLVRYREVSVGASSGALKKEEYYDPHRVRLDATAENSTAGKTFVQLYKHYTVDTPNVPADAGTAGADGGTSAGDGGLVTTQEDGADSWSVVAVDEEITVPYGTFKALVVERVVPSAQSDKKFWFVRGIGKVKETGVQDQTEVLSEFVPAP